MRQINEDTQILKVDLKALSGRVFVGRANGKLAREYFKLDAIEGKDTKVEFIIPADTISVNSSFFLGLFGPDVQRIGDYDRFFQYVDISKVDERYRQQLQIAVKRTLSTSGYGL